MAISAGVAALNQLYAPTKRTVNFLTGHIDTLKGAESAVVARCGELLEQVIIGFGVGETAGLALIGLGQALLGNPLTATAASATPTPIAPIALTCAAIGAVHYGWGALSEKEKLALIDRVSSAFQVGVELIRAIVRFALETIKVLLSRDNLAELRSYVASAAAQLGKKLSELTGSIGDRANEIVQSVSALAVDGVQAVGAYLPGRPSSPSSPDQ